MPTKSKNNKAKISNGFYCGNKKDKYLIPDAAGDLHDPYCENERYRIKLTDLSNWMTAVYEGNGWWKLIGTHIRMRRKSMFAVGEMIEG